MEPNSQALAGILVISACLVTLRPACRAQAAQLDVKPAVAKSERVMDSYVLGPNDQITVQCLNAEEFTDKPVRVDGDGTVALPFVGRIKVAGLTVSQVEAQLRKQLAAFLREPEVQVNLAESQSQPVSVIGAVTAPGVHQLQGRKTLIELLSAAGGLKPEAGRSVRVTRRLEWGRLPLPGAQDDPEGKSSVAEISLKDLIEARNPAVNIEIRPRDVISVPKAELVYVVGEVKKPGGFMIADRESISVLEAISLAEGLERTAAGRSARILRPKDSGVQAATDRTEIPVNVAKILSGRIPDVPLRAGDILFVPNNSAKSAGLRAVDAMIQLTTGVLIYRR